MKKISFVILLFLSLNSFSTELVKLTPKKVIHKNKLIKNRLIVPVPCESKEEILKKIAEKKEIVSGKIQGFSLQGGNTGCSVK